METYDRVFLTILFSLFLVPSVAPRAWFNNDQKPEFSLQDTVAIAVLCNGDESRSNVTFSINDPEEVKEIVRSLDGKGSFDANVLFTSANASLLFKDTKGNLQRASLIVANQAVAFEGNWKHAQWVTAKATQILLHAKPDCLKSQDK